MSNNPLQTKADKLEDLGIWPEVHKVDEIALATLDGEARVTLFERDFSAFSKAIEGALNPNSALKSALAAAKKSVRRA